MNYVLANLVAMALSVPSARRLTSPALYLWRKCAAKKWLTGLFGATIIAVGVGEYWVSICLLSAAAFAACAHLWQRDQRHYGRKSLETIGVALVFAACLVICRQIQAAADGSHLSQPMTGFVASAIWDVPSIETPTHTLPIPQAAKTAPSVYKELAREQQARRERQANEVRAKVEPISPGLIIEGNNARVDDVTVTNATLEVRPTASNVRVRGVRINNEKQPQK
jgi:hypothetical protein